MKYLFYLSVLCLILLRYKQTIPVYKDGDFVRISAKVYSEPIVYESQQYVKLLGLSFYLPKYPEITYGDYLVVVGEVKDQKLVNPKLIEISQDKNQIYGLREKLIYFYKSNLPEPYASLVAGITIGSKNMPQDFWDRLKSTGTAHIVVASGTNVTLTISLMIGIFTYWMKRKSAIIVTLLGIAGYVILSGFDAPIIRAGIMGSVLLIGQEAGRVISSWRVLFYAAAIMLIIKPAWITDIGFILSFTATISLIVFEKKIAVRLKIIPAIFREGLSTSLAAQIGVAPILFATFGSFNILSPIINMLVLWTVPFIMVAGALAGLIGLVVPVIGRLILFVIYPLLWYFVNLIELFI